MIMLQNWEVASNEEIADHCSRDNPAREIIEELEGGRSVIRISERVIVKCGFGVSQWEAVNQQEAFRLLDPTVVRVPEVFRFFAKGSNGYLVMEYIEGSILSSLPDCSRHTHRVAEVLEYFESIQRERPGPLHGNDKGCPTGHLWFNDVGISASSILEIQDYYNSRQLRSSKQVDFSSLPIVFCHLDIATRNIILMPDDTLCLIDWASAGFYPRIFERFALGVNINPQNIWNIGLLELLTELHEHEKQQMELLAYAYHLAQKYSYSALAPGLKPAPRRLQISTADKNEILHLSGSASTMLLTKSEYAQS